MFTVDASLETQPGLTLITTDPELATGFVVALASSWHSDVWVLPTAWAHIGAASPKAEGFSLLINTSTCKYSHTRAQRAWRRRWPAIGFRRRGRRRSPGHLNVHPEDGTASGLGKTGGDPLVGQFR